MEDKKRRAALLLGEARSLLRAGAGSEQALQYAVDAQVTAEVWEAAAQAELLLARWLREMARSMDEVLAHLALAAGHAARVPASETMCLVAAQQARHLIMRGEEQDALVIANRMLPIAEDGGFAAGYETLLGARGWARGSLGDPGGIDDLRTAGELAVERDDPNLSHSLHESRGGGARPGRHGGCRRCLRYRRTFGRPLRNPLRDRLRGHRAGPPGLPRRAMGQRPESP